MIGIIEKFNTPNSRDLKNLDLSEKVVELEARIQEMEKRQQYLAQHPIIIENLYIRRMYADKLQFKLDEISVEELSGMLNVGINNGGKMKKEERNK